MADTRFDIYLAGVGGQGIGMLSEVILRAADHAGFQVRAVDTHGLAQRGGIVVSQVRLGKGAHSPLIPAGRAHLAVALERHEALRALAMVRPKGTLVYYDTAWQPLDVRLGTAKAVDAAAIDQACAKADVACHRVRVDDLADVRMQNTALLAYLARHRLVPGVSSQDFRCAMEDLMAGAMLAANTALFDKLAA